MSGTVWTCATVHCPNPLDWALNGVFSTREAAIAACRTEWDCVVEWTLDKDCTDLNDRSDYVEIWPLRNQTERASA